MVDGVVIAFFLPRLRGGLGAGTIEPVVPTYSAEPRGATPSRGSSGAPVKDVDAPETAGDPNVSSARTNRNVVEAAGSPFFNPSASSFLDFFNTRLTGFFAELEEVEAEGTFPDELSACKDALPDLRGRLVPVSLGAVIWPVRVSARKTCAVRGCYDVPWIAPPAEGLHDAETQSSCPNVPSLAPPGRWGS